MEDGIIRWQHCKKHNKDYLVYCPDCTMEKRLKETKAKPTETLIYPLTQTKLGEDNDKK